MLFKFCKIIATTTTNTAILMMVMIIITITRGALSRAQVSPPGSVDHKAGSELYG